MNELRKTIINFILTVATLLFSAVFWDSAALLSVLLALVAIAMLLLERHKSAFIIYLVGFLFGPLSESLLIYSGAWAYTDPYILGFSLWLPFIWGNAALFINRLNIFIRFQMSR